MSQIITVDTVDREYEDAHDPIYADRLDKGDTRLGVVSVPASTNLAACTSHLLKNRGLAGKSGRRQGFTAKDIVPNAVTGVNDEFTVVCAFYGPNSPTEAAVRYQHLLSGMQAALLANDAALLKKLALGVIAV